MASELVVTLQLGLHASTVSLYDTTADLFADLFDGNGGGVELIVADEHTAPLIPPGRTAATIVVPAGERAKDLGVLSRVVEAMVDAGLTRDAAVVGVGGGAVTDLVAFAASVYLRGIRCVLVPTSLLAMVDAAIGGKTGIDFGGYKNMVGTFAPASDILLTPGFLTSLSDREFRSGLAEVIKAGLLGDQALVSLLEEHRESVLRRDHHVLREAIVRAVRVKAAVVQADFTETGTRAHLNLGHTFGHALEAVLGLGEITHGEAVAWGIARAAETAVSLGIGDAAWGERTRKLLDDYGYPTAPRPAEADAVVKAMRYDKKRRRDGLRCVLQTGPQRTVVTPVSETLLRSVVEGSN